MDYSTARVLLNRYEKAASMNIAGKFHNSTSPAAISERLLQQEAAAGMAEFNSEFSAFCRTLDMKVGELDKLPQNIVLTLMCMRILNLLLSEVEKLNARIFDMENPTL